MIKSFKDLTKNEMKDLYQFVTNNGNFHDFNSYEEMISDYQGEIFNNGTSLFILFYNNYIIGTIGVITKEIESKGEGIITNFTVNKDYKDQAHLLINKAECYLMNYKPNRIKIGLNHHFSFLDDVILTYNYHFAFHALKLSLTDISYLVKDLTPVHFMPLLRENQKIFQTIHNETFLLSPNGALLTDQGLEELFNQTENNHEVYIAYQDEPFGILHVSHNGRNGTIETIGITPSKQGQGLGKYLVAKAVEILTQYSVENISLFVISSNQKAIQLYKKNGFHKSEVRSFWYEK